SHRQTRRAISEGGDYSGQLVPRDRRRSATVEAIGPGRGPRQLGPDESRRMNLNDDVVYRCLRLGSLHELHPGRSCSLVRYHYRLHDNRLLGHLSVWSKRCRGDQEFQAVMTEAKLQPPDKRVLFLERIEAVVRLSNWDVQTAINEAMAGLKYNTAAHS